MTEYNVYFQQYLFINTSGISREGISFLDLSVACEHIGLRTKALRISWDKLQLLPLQCIIHWQNSHFIDVYKVKANKVWVSYPAKGLVTYASIDFKKGWLGNNTR